MIRDSGVAERGNFSLLIVRDARLVLLENMDYKTCKVIPNLLRKYRRIRGLSQKQVARILGLKSASRVSRWEKGSCIPSHVNVVKLSIVYRTMADALFRDLSRTLREEIYRREKQILGPESPNK